MPFSQYHLGINDLRNPEIHLNQIKNNLIYFMGFVKRQSPTSRIFISLPLYVDDNDINLLIYDARQIMKDVAIDSYDTTEPAKDRRMFINENRRTTPGNSIDPDLLSSDGIHPSEKGKDVLLSIMRRSIHEITRIILGKPVKTRPRPSRT